MCSLDAAVDREALLALERELCTLAGEITAATCRWIELLGRFDEQEGWREFGMCSTANWLSWRCSLGEHAARQYVRVARALPMLPMTRRAFRRGELSYCKVRAITRVARADTESQWLALAREATGAQLEKAVRSCRRAAAMSALPPEDPWERRELWYDRRASGTFELRVTMTAEEGELLMAALERAEGWPQSPFRPDEISADEPYAGTGVNRRVDAFMSLVRAGADADGRERLSGDACEVVVHVDAETLTSDTIHERAETDSGVTLAPETIRRLGCDTAIRGVVERDRVEVARGRRTRTVPATVRRALRARDRGCAFPGCSHSRFLHAHHIEHWARGGPSTLDNLVQLCSHHHHLVHEGGFSVVRARRGNGFVFRNPHGRPVPRCGPPQRARWQDLPHRNQLNGVLIDPGAAAARTLDQRADYGLISELFTPLLFPPAPDTDASPRGRIFESVEGGEDTHR